MKAPRFWIGEGDLVVARASRQTREDVADPSVHGAGKRINLVAAISACQREK
jgi:hypothetical protein